ncbi:hypothetical protein TNIN_27871 [Trichonephila inaurata madagascariensis]|uniref:Uncharacterized protein n=1 Tax=Trichonephila inaurata madagascariensis TaxID=2747483 RepID=A0A8X7CKS7_9ARAC|nr:hypothetical protein TNIN_27871 [Trichonephila inaurata madagascariensis]
MRNHRAVTVIRRSDSTSSGVLSSGMSFCYIERHFDCNWFMKNIVCGEGTGAESFEVCVRGRKNVSGVENGWKIAICVRD